jgi:hypothetical protein
MMGEGIARYHDSGVKYWVTDTLTRILLYSGLKDGVFV